MLMAGIHLIPIILSAGAASHHDGSINKYRLPVLIQNADYVAISRVISFEGRGTTAWCDENGNTNPDVEPETLYTTRFKCDTVLNLGTHAPNTTLIVEITGLKPNPIWTRDPPERPWGWNYGDIGFVFAFAPKGQHRLIDAYAISERLRYIRLAPDEAFGMWIYQLPVKLPNANYVREGSTNVRRVMSVFAQAYNLNPKENRNYYWKLYELIPDWHRDRTTGKLVIDEPGFTDPDIIAFMQDKIVVRLTSGAGDDPVNKLWALSFACSAGNPDREIEYRQRLEELEERYDKPDEQGLIPGIPFRYNDPGREYWLEKLRSRLSTVRRFAVFGLSTERQNIQPIVQLFERETSWEVIKACADWLRSMKTDNYKLFSDAPFPSVDLYRKVVDNRSELIEYWSSKG